MKKLKYILITIAIISIINIPSSLNKFVVGSIDVGHFRYSNEDASYTYTEGFSFKTGIYNKEAMESSNENENKKEVFRIYTINPLCFWRWRYYWQYSRQFKYKSWAEIEPNRVPYDGDKYNSQQKF